MEDDRDLRDALFFQRLNPLRLTVAVAQKEEEGVSSTNGTEGEEKENGGSSKEGGDRAGNTKEGEGEGADAARLSVGVPECGSAPQRVVVRLRSAQGVEVQEDHGASELLLGVTAEKVAAVVQAAMRSRSSLFLEITFLSQPASQPDGGNTGDTGAEPGPTNLLSAGLPLAPSAPSAPPAGDAAATMLAPGAPPALMAHSLPSSVPHAVPHVPAVAAPSPCAVCGLSGVPGPRYASLL